MSKIKAAKQLRRPLHIQRVLPTPRTPIETTTTRLINQICNYGAYGNTEELQYFSQGLTPRNGKAYLLALLLSMLRQVHPKLHAIGELVVCPSAGW
jgi:hypothetical protein